MLGETIAHYEVLEKLGEGGMGVVYKARDTKLKRSVALKFLPATLTRDYENRERFIREAQAAAILDHPNICAIHAIEEAEGRIFIVMPCIHGQPLEERIASGPLRIDEALDIAIQTARGLREAHGKGITHRDIKSANIMLSANDHARIMDFGLVKFSGRTRLTKTATIMGTVDYMSPEQAQGDKDTDHRTDIWSLGVVLYEMLSGRKPFEANSDAALLHKIIYEDPIELRNFEPEPPEDLSCIVLRAMAKDKEDRYGAVSQLLEDLLSCRAGRLSTSTSVSAGIAEEQPPHPFASKTPFAGREREMAELSSFLRRAAGGRGMIVVIGGEAGVGKTRLTEELMVEARRQGLHVLTGHCHQGEDALPYVPFVEIIESVARSLSPESLILALGDSAPDVAKVMPELHGIVPDIAASPSRSEGPDQRYILNSLRTFFERLANRKPLLIVLEDLHWADKASLQLVLHISTHLRVMPVLLVGTYQDTDLERSHELYKVLAGLRRTRVYKRISLRGLHNDEAGTLIKAWLGGEPPPAFVKAIHNQTEGNPFFIEEILRYLNETGAICQRDGRVMTDFSLDQLSIPDEIKDVILGRLARLSEKCNSILTIASVIGREFDLDSLARASNLDEDTLADLLEEAVRAKVVTEMPGIPGRYRFAHILIYESLYEGLTTTRRIRLHGQTLHYADQNGAKLAYEIVGGSGPYVIAVGLSSCAAVRSRHMSIATKWDQIAQNCRVILYDRRGVGFSAAPESGYNLEAGVEDLRAVLDAVGAQRAVVWGATDGGPLAVIFAVQYPQRVAGLVLGGTTAKLINSDDFGYGINPVAIVSFINTDSADPGRAVSQLTRTRSGARRADAIGEVYRRIPKHAWYEILAALVNADVRDLLPQIQIPTLIIHDPDNQYIPVGAAYYLHEHIPGSRLEVSEEYGARLFGISLQCKIMEFIDEVTTGDLMRD